MAEGLTSQQMTEQQQLTVLTPERSIVEAVDMANNGVKHTTPPEKVLGGIVMPNVMRSSD